MFVFINLLTGDECKTTRDMPCIFPFVHNGNTYNECDDFISRGKMYKNICATKVNEESREINRYGFCMPSCSKSGKWF